MVPAKKKRNEFLKQIQPGWIFVWRVDEGPFQWILTLEEPRNTLGGIWYDVKVCDLATGQIFNSWPAENLVEMRLVSKSKLL